MFLQILVIVVVFFIGFYSAYKIVEFLTPIKIVDGLPAQTINTMIVVVLAGVIIYLIGSILIFAGIPF